MKKKKWSRFRHKVIFTLFRIVFRIFFFFKFNFRVKKVKLPNEGALILCNHTMAFDPFLIGCRYNKPIYYMTSKDLFQNKFIGKLISWLVKPIPKEKSNKNDLSAIKDCLTVSKENGTICIFPEGNRTFTGKLGNIDYSIVKLVKLLKKPLIICNIIGGYSSDPRWSNKRRKGKIELVERAKLEYDDYKDMDSDDLYNLITENLTVEEYNLEVEFKGRKKAEYLDSIFHICPVCHKEHTITSKNNDILCTNCGLKVTYTNDRKLISDNALFKFNYVHEWYDYQIEILKEKTYNNDEVIYEDEIKVYIPKMNEKKEFVGSGLIRLYNDHFKFILNDKELIISFENINAVTLLGRMKMNIYTTDVCYQVYNDRRTNLIKYMHVYYLISNKERGIEDGFIGI